MYIIPVAVLVVLIMWRRIAATKKPIRGNGFKILLPVLYILCGSAWFFNPHVQSSATPIVIAALLGLIMSVPLIVTTNYEVRGDGNIYAKKSRAFIVSLIVLVVLRFALGNVIQEYNISTMIMLLYVIAATYLIPWRIASFMKFRKILQNNVHI